MVASRFSRAQAYDVQNQSTNLLIFLVVLIICSNMVPKVISVHKNLHRGVQSLRTDRLYSYQGAHLCKAVLQH